MLYHSNPIGQDYVAVEQLYANMNGFAMHDCYGPQCTFAYSVNSCYFMCLFFTFCIYVIYVSSPLIYLFVSVVSVPVVFKLFEHVILQGF